MDTFAYFSALRQDNLVAEKENDVNKVDDDKSDYESDWEAEIDPQGEVFHIQPMPEFTASPEIPLKSRKIKHFNYFTSFQKRTFFFVGQRKTRLLSISFLRGFLGLKKWHINRAPLI